MIGIGAAPVGRRRRPARCWCRWCAPARSSGGSRWRTRGSGTCRARAELPVAIQQMSRGEPVIPTAPRLTGSLRGMKRRADRDRRPERLLRGRLAARRRRRPGGRRHRDARCTAGRRRPEAPAYDHVVATKDHHIAPGLALVPRARTSGTRGRSTAGSARTARRSTRTSTRSRSTRSSSRASTRRRTPASRAGRRRASALADWLRAHEVDRGRHLRDRDRLLRADDRAGRRRRGVPDAGADRAVRGRRSGDVGGCGRRDAGGGGRPLSEYLSVDVSDCVLCLTFNRPEIAQRGRRHDDGVAGRSRWRARVAGTTSASS